MTSAFPILFGPALATVLLWLAVALPATAAEKPPSEPRLNVVTAGAADMPRRHAAPHRGRRVRPEKELIDPIQTGSVPKLPDPPAPVTEAKAPVARVTQTDAQQYCTNIASVAADARFAWQAKKLADLEGQIKQRIADLEAKQVEYKSWLAKREDALKAAEKSLVGIYAKMRPEAASSQLSALDDTTAAAVLSQLSARSASAILNEMDTKRAARLANAIAGNNPPSDQQGKKQP